MSVIPDMVIEDVARRFCSSGHRAAIATSLLDRADIPVRLVARGEPIGWIERFDRLAASAAIGF